MAARRIAQSSINWASMAERVPEAQRAQFAAFKARSDVYLRAVLANPEKPPQIDWTYYKKLIPAAAMVDSFQKQYEAIKVPYPGDNMTPQVEAQAKEVKQEIDSFKRASEQRIAEHKQKIAHLESLLPIEQMTQEDFRDAFPELALDPINRPTFWPHDAEEQLDGTENQKSAEHH